jgi:hypothetical protein
VWNGGDDFSVEWDPHRYVCFKFHDSGAAWWRELTEAGEVPRTWTIDCRWATGDAPSSGVHVVYALAPGVRFPRYNTFPWAESTGFNHTRCPPDPSKELTDPRMPTLLTEFPRVHPHEMPDLPEDVAHEFEVGCYGCGRGTGLASNEFLEAYTTNFKAGLDFTTPMSVLKGAGIPPRELPGKSS